MNAPAPAARDVLVRAATLREAVEATHAALLRGPTRLRLEHAPSGDAMADAAHAEAIRGFGRSLRIELRGRTTVDVAPHEVVTTVGMHVPPARDTAPRCVITGAGSGIGRALALEFGAAGYVVCGVDVNARAAARTETELRELGIPANIAVSDLRHLERLPCSESAPADVVIHNAGISQVGPFVDTPVDEALGVVALNLEAPLRLTERLFAERSLARGGTLVFVSSLSHFVGYPGASVYAGTKDGLAAYAEALRSARCRDAVGVLTVFPGPVRTAHARRYSPHNSGELRRMDPAELARQTRTAVEAGRPHLVPGPVNQLMAWVGRRFPPVADQLMDRTIFRRLPSASAS